MRFCRLLGGLKKIFNFFKKKFDKLEIFAMLIDKIKTFSRKRDGVNKIENKVAFDLGVGRTPSYF